MKARIANSLSARCGGGCPPRRTYTREGERRAEHNRVRRRRQPERRRKTGEENGKKAGVLLEKDGRKEGKEDEFRKKVHKFSFSIRLIPRKQNFFSQKLRIFQTKSLPLRLINTTFPFPAALRRPYSAKSRGNPDEAAQMLFDLLKNPDTPPCGEHREENLTECCDYPQWKNRSTRAAISRGLSAMSARRVRSP